ncbi:MAG: ABC transporter permease [Erysipelotrichaceae bacterium]|nr:ABC transporter permease [Erysipelotrichaceae bacterium]
MMNERIIVEKPLNQRVKKISYKVFVISFIAIVLLITYTPILVMGITSFSTDPFGYRFTGFTFSWYSKLFTNGELNESIMFTLQITFLSTLISTIFGTITAIGINVLNRNAKKKIIVLNNVPILNADIVTAVFLLLVFQIISIIIGVNIIAEYSFVTTLIAHVLFSTPYVVLSVLPKLNKDNSLYDAAIDLGCSPYQALYKVIIPNIKSGIFSGALLAFTMSIDDFIITYFVSGDKDNFSTWLYGNLKTLRNGQWNQACAYNTVLMVITFIGIIGYQLISNKKKKEEN